MDRVPQLEFLNPVFRAGRNLTVRRGTKWSGVPEAAVPALSPVPRPLATRVLSFLSLVDGDLADEHDPACRTVSGLQSAMERAYPGFDPREIVTLVVFDVRPEEI